MNADGSSPSPWTNSPADEGGPAWSPDGTKIAFATNPDGNAEIYVGNTDGSNQARLTDAPGDDLMPAWSPDGTTTVSAVLAHVRSLSCQRIQDGTVDMRDTAPAMSHEEVKVTPTIAAQARGA